MTVYIAADHRGYELKNILKNFIELELHLKVVDVGAFAPDPADDYPDYVNALHEQMEKDPGSMGIAICGSGAGVCVAANKFGHLRCGMGMTEKQVEAARNDDNINVLALASDYTNAEAAKQMTQIFIQTSFSNLDRHIRRLAKTTQYANRTRGAGTLS